MPSPCVHFLKQIKSINETDYGDFMRKANLYLNELKEQDEIKNSALAARLDVMQDYIQYHPNWDIPTTRAHIEEDADRLIRMEAQYSL